MRNERKNRKVHLNRKKTVFIVAVLVFVILAILIEVFKGKNVLVKQSPEQKRQQQIKENINRVKDTTYITDVDYTGETYLEPDIFEIPFRKSESGYTNNKEFVKTVSENTLEKIQKTSSSYVHTLLSNGYQRVKNDQDGFINSICNMSSPQFRMIENDTNVTPSELAEKARDWYIENEMQLDSKYVTDRCLIYEDGQIFNRGELHFTVYKGKSLAALEKMTGIKKIEIGKEYVIYFEISYIPNIYDQVFSIQRIVKRDSNDTVDISTENKSFHVHKL